MHSTRWKQRFVATFLAAAVLLLVLVSSQHRDRLIAGSYETIDSFGRRGSDDSLRFLTRTPLSQAPGFSEAVSVLRTADSTYPLLPGDALPVIDQPDTCLLRFEEGRPIHCYNADIAAAVILSKQKIPARLWEFNGSRELGGDGHNLIEIFDGISKSWKAIDPYYHCYFTLGQDATPTTVPLLRHALLTSPESVHLVRYSDTTRERPDSNIIAEFKFLAPGAMLHANNDFAWRYEHRYGWLTPVAAPLFDALPLRDARGVRTIMLGSRDRLLVIEDRFSPHFPFTWMKVIFWTLVILFGISVIGIVVTVTSKRRGRSVRP